ncbi:LAGLIDADG family homing endonuclease [Candidatus Uhrbacteria bacterium]|nr:LAGLIDADG family homing endonuclease [Candidatus Uhrbacteria bacterium]
MRIFDNHYITGLLEWGGSFTYLRSKGGITVCFVMKSSTRDLPLLLKVRDFFGVGKVYRGGVGTQKWVYYRVNKLGELITMVRHFEQYPLQGMKQHAFAIWKEMVNCKRRKLPKDKAKIMELAVKLSRMNSG